MKGNEITVHEFTNHMEDYLDAALAEQVIYIRKDDRHVCIVGDTRWMQMIETLSAVLLPSGSNRTPSVQ